MSLWLIAWRSIQRRGLASILTSTSMALGVMLVVAVLLMLGVITESFRNNSSLGYNMIVGAKGGRLQLVLNTVYYLSSPVENIPYAYYQEFLGASDRDDGKDGKFKMFTTMAIPVCLGDYYEGFRVVGTTPQLFDQFVYDIQKGRIYEFSEGRNFRHKSEEFGYFEAVIGAAVAREAGLKLGDTLSPTHGPEGHAHDAFHVVGILKSSGTPNDRAVFVNMEGFYLLDGHAKTVETSENESKPEQTGERQDMPGEATLVTETVVEPTDDNALGDAPAAFRPLPIEQREVTAILLRTVNPLVTAGLRNTINEGPVAQAVLPIAEIYTLFSNFVTPIQRVLLFLTMMICTVSGVSILVSIYNSMSDRRHEIAVMRALGAGRATVLSVILMESIILSLGGGLLGWAAGHVLIGGFASPAIESRTGVSIRMIDLAPPPRLLENLESNAIINGISSELLLVPALILLAIIVGFFPAVSAYRTDVARALGANP